jgi:DNA-directed RNA polymerase specialized sigma24 family protein
MADEHASVSVWMQQLKAGDRDLPVEKLWERYFQRLVGLARHKMAGLPRRVADEEDVALSAFDSFCQGVARGKFPQLDDRDNLWRLLVTITARKVYQLNLTNSCQKRGGNAVLDEAALTGPADTGDGGIGLEQFVATDPTPEFAAQAAEEFAQLLALLPDGDLRSLAQWKMEGYTNKEIAARLGCVVRSVERRLRTIRICWDGRDGDS